VPVATREWQLAARPHGEPTPDDFRLVEREHPDPADGQVVVRMLVMSVDPYMRGRMRAGRSYAAAWEVEETMKGGAVGSLVGQFARLRGAGSVIGSAGSPEKVRWLTDELGFTAAFDYHAGPVAQQLAAAAPDGIDVYFDNVGGDHLEAAIGALRVHGRAAICGSISGYNAVSPPPGPRNMSLLVASRLTLRGFLVGDHTDLRPAFLETVSGWLASGELVVRETVREGLDDAVPAFLDLLRGGNTGKMIVRLADS
jgi:NADPH-dependent curcumin reductase CurA